jgi:ribosome-binding protein aMBF1 (putative translation factor)
MSDGLPRLLPNDPKNLLSLEARKRIQRARIEAEKFILETEVAIEARHPLDWDSDEANSLRSKARFKHAKAALTVYRREFSRIDIPERAYRKFMKDEIEAASTSLQLTQTQQRLLETEFFFPEEKAMRSRTSTIPSTLAKKPDTLGSQINRLREECHLTEEELAEKIDIDIRSVQRHLAGETVPYARYLRRYETEFSKLLNRRVVIRKMP